MQLSRHRLTALMMAAAVGVGSTAGALAQGKMRIGLVLPDLSNEAIADIDIGARARADELGTVEVLTTGSYSGEEQAKAVENYIAMGVDLIAYDSIDAAAVGPALVKANEAGIPVISVISAASSGDLVSFITPDFTENGRIIGRWMSQELGPDGVVAHVEGNPADAAGAALTQGFKEGLAEGGIEEIVAMAPSDWDRERGMTVASNILTAHPNLQGLYGANDDVAMGALQAIKGVGRKDEVLLAGHNGTCEAIAAMLRDDLNFTVMLFNRSLGALMVDVALDVADGKDVPALIPAPVLGLDNVSAKALLDGTGEPPPEIVRAEVQARLEAARDGCK